MNATRTRLPLRAVAGALLPLALLAGCGSGDSGDTGGGSEGSSQSAESGGSEEPLTTDTAMDAIKAAYDDSRTAAITLTIGGGNGQSIEAEGVLEIDEQTTDMAMTMTIPGQGDIDLRVIDEIVYVQTPDSGGKFLSVDPSDESNPLAAQFSQLADSSGLDSTFDAFDAGLREVEFQESTTIGDDEVDHYVFTVDTAAALEAQGQQAPQGMPEQLEYDVYLDSEDRFRRVDLEVAGSQTRIDIDQWGEPVEIEKPADDQITEPPGA